MQRRIGHVLDLEVVEVTSHQVRLELQRSEPQNRHRTEVTPFEIRPRLCRIDRCDIKQQIQAALDVGQTGIDIKSRRKLLGRGCHLTNALSSGWVSRFGCGRSPHLVSKGKSRRSRSRSPGRYQVVLL